MCGPSASDALTTKALKIIELKEINDSSKTICKEKK